MPASTAETPLLPQHQGQRRDYQATAQKAGEAGKQAADKAKRGAQQLRDKQPDIEYALAALRAGKMPTTEQFTSWLEYLADSSLLQEGTFAQTGALSDEGARVVSDIRQVLGALSHLAQSKNADDKIQEFLHHTVHAGSVAQDKLESGASFRDSSSGTAVQHELPSQKQMQKDAQRLIRSLGKVGYLIATDAEFNNVIADLVLVARDLLADAAGEAADRVKEAGERVRPGEDARQASGQERRDKALDLSSGGNAGEGFEEIKQKGKQLSQQAPSSTGDARNQARDVAQRGASWLQDRLPSEFSERDAFVERLQRVVSSVMERQEYQEAIDVILYTVRRYAKTAKQVAEKAKEEGKQKAEEESDESFERAAKELKEILERFAGGHSLDPLIDAFKHTIEDAKDERISSHLQHLDSFIERLLKDPEFVQSRASSREMDNLYEEAQQLLRTNKAWKQDAHELNAQLQSFAKALRQDEESRALMEALKRLADDVQGVAKGLAENAFGALGEAKSLARDLVDVWIPRLINNIKVIPLPRVEYKSADLDAIVDGITLVPGKKTFLPDRIAIVNRNEAELFNGYAAFASTFSSATTLRIEGLRFAADQVSYYLNRKNAIFHKVDWGLLSISATGQQGVCATVEIEQAKDADREHYFKVKSVKVDVDTLRIQVRKSHHPISNFFFARLAQPYLRDIVCKLLEEKLEEALGALDMQLKLLHVRTSTLANYAATAHNPLKRGGFSGAPSVTGYFSALFGQGFSPFSSSRSSKTSSAARSGIVKKGRAGDWLLTIGASQHIVDAQPGPRGWAEKHEEMLAEAQRKFDMLRSGASGLKSEFAKAGQSVERKAQELAKEDDWRSDAFDIPL